MALLILGVPAGYAIAVTSVMAFVIKWGYGSLSFGLLAQMLVYGVNRFPIMAIPLFLLAGAIMNSGGISDRIFAFAQSLIGHVRGGIAYVNVLASFIFSGMSGAAAADVAGLGKIEIRAMQKAGYDKDFSCAVTGASATIGPVVPPSIPLVMYGVLANASITKLFIGGLIPGILMMVSLMACCGVIARKRGYPRSDSFEVRRAVSTFRSGFLPLLTPVIIIGGIWSGVFTPTEAAAVAAFYALILGTVVYRAIKIRELVGIFKRTAIDSSAILFILAAAMIYNNALTRTQVPQVVTDLLFSFSESGLVILILLNVVLFIAGMFMSTAETILLLTPLIAPLLPQFGIDPVHFGVLMVLNLMIGQLTPPFGIVLYVLASVGDIELDRLVRALIPFYIPIFVVLILLIIFPPLVTYLPGLVLGR